ncbi:hypothetical protein M9Y10_011909 [Tritrichomonas musculus]|uniref:Oxidoreductase, short chain dehydrogenase/reductase family protein n=1 Tax=Tritrichomonas musculus TaxID=1915356 RepID=A0ABR2IB54_9EUKA
MQRNVWFVTGASQGLGLSLVKELLAQNFKVTATSRNRTRLEGAVGQKENDHFLPLELDLTNEDCVKKAIDATVSKFGTIDVCVNNAGHGLRGSVEETTVAESRQLFEDNFFSMHSVLRHVLPIMRKNRNGFIYNIASIGALVNPPLSPFYSATKAAVVSMSQCLAAEVQDYNIKVVPVEPGPFETNFFKAENLITVKNLMPEYDVVRQRRAKSSAGGDDKKKDGDPDRAAKIFIEISKLEDVPKLLFIGKTCLDWAKPKIDQLESERLKWKDYTSRCSYE